jgi:hypothetical protein
MQDAVSRLSLHNVAALLDEMLVALARCKQPTCKVRRHCLSLWSFMLQQPHHHIHKSVLAAHGPTVGCSASFRLFAAATQCNMLA